jgi:hypothetical protein
MAGATFLSLTRAGVGWQKVKGAVALAHKYELFSSLTEIELGHIFDHCWLKP